MATAFKKWAIGFDLGGTNLRAALVSTEGKLKYRISHPTKSNRGQYYVIRDIKNIIKELLAKSPNKVLGVGIGAPGPLDPSTGTIVNSPNLKWQNVPLKTILEKEVGIDVTVDNDSQMTAFGEHWIGAGRGANDLLLLTLGTGVGGGIIVNGSIYHGETGSAGHVGHYILDTEGPICACGARGCLEAYASGPSIVRRTLEAILNGHSSILKKIIDQGTLNITPLRIFEAAKNGDILAIDILRDTGSYIGQVLASLIPILDPKLIIFSGQVSLAGEFILNPVRERIAGLLHLRPEVPVIQGTLGDDGGIIGSAGVVFKESGMIL